MGVIRALVQYGSAQVAAKLGRCGKCMGLSLIGAVLGWGVFSAVVDFWPQCPFLNVVALLPVSFTALWVLHILTYGARFVKAAPVRHQEPMPVAGPLMTRRRMMPVLGMFAVGIGSGMFLSTRAAAVTCLHVGQRCGSCATPGSQNTTCVSTNCCKSRGGCRPVYDRVLGCQFCTCQI